MGAIANVDDLPTGADATLTATEDTALVLTAANFGYQDEDGDALSHVKITTLPSNGTLKLSGSAVSKDDEVTKADIDAGNLKFEAAANAFGLHTILLVLLLRILTCRCSGKHTYF